MIEEFAADPQVDWTERGLEKIWLTKISIALMWVSSARESGITTIITMAGSERQHEINIRYEDFMVKWMAAKKGG